MSDRKPLESAEALARRVAVAWSASEEIAASYLAADRLEVVRRALEWCGANPELLIPVLYGDSGSVEIDPAAVLREITEEK